MLNIEKTLYVPSCSEFKRLCMPLRDCIIAISIIFDVERLIQVILFACMLGKYISMVGM
jgi:hypothetical protein